MIKDFAAFLKKYNIVTLTVGFVMGVASNDLVKSFVDDILMPIIMPITSNQSWRTATLNFGPIQIAYGAFVAQLINFFMLAIVVFILANKIIRINQDENDSRKKGEKEEDIGKPSKSSKSSHATTSSTKVINPPHR